MGESKAGFQDTRGCTDESQSRKCPAASIFFITMLKSGKNYTFLWISGEFPVPAVKNKIKKKGIFLWNIAYKILKSLADNKHEVLQCYLYHHFRAKVCLRSLLAESIIWPVFANAITGIKTRTLVGVEAVSVTSEIEVRKQSSEEQIWKVSERIDFQGFDI